MYALTKLEDASEIQLLVNNIHAAPILKNYKLKTYIPRFRIHFIIYISIYVSIRCCF